VCHAAQAELDARAQAAAGAAALALVTTPNAAVAGRAVVTAVREALRPFRASLLIPQNGGWRVSESSDAAHARDVLIAPERYPELLAVRRSASPCIIPDASSASELEGFREVLARIGICSLLAFPVFIVPGSAEAVVLRVSWDRPISAADAALAVLLSHLLLHRLADLPPADVVRDLEIPGVRPPQFDPASLLRFVPMPALVVEGDGEVVHANPRAQRILVPTGEAPHGFETIPAGAWKGQQRRWEAGVATTQGELRIMGWSAELAGGRMLVLVDEHPETVGDDRAQAIRAAFVDKVRELEETNRQLRELVEMRVRFVSDAAHELKTPLAILRSYLETIDTDLAEGLSEDQLAFVRAAATGATRLQRLVEKLLDLAALESGHMPLELGPVSLRQVTAVAAEEMQPLAEQAGVELVVEDPDEVIVRADRDGLAQVARNLLENAVKYTPRGRRITLCTATRADSGLLDIADEGYGIPPEALPRVFEPFFRASPPSASDGAGLGLSIVRRLVLAMGGRVVATSQTGVGSRFRVELPLWTDVA
jgi:signal transduction histidine kinase